MVDNEESKPETTQEDRREDSTGRVSGPGRRATGPLKGDSGTETAQVWISAFLIALLGFLVYLGSFSIQLHGEDLRIFSGSDALHRLVTAPNAIEALPASPLSAVGLALAGSLTGGRVDALHALSLFLHLACAILVFLIARRLLPRETPEAVSMLAGLVFVVHPAINVPVNYLSAYPVLQSSFFGLMGFLLLLRGASREQTFCVASLAGAVLAFVLAFGSHTAALLLPLVGLGLIILAPESGRGSRTFIRAAIPTLILTLVALWVTGRAAGVLDASVITSGPGDRLAAFLGLLGKVLVLLVWPFNQSLLPEPGGIIPGVAVLILGIAAIVAGFRRYPALGQIGLWVVLAAFSSACYGPADYVATTRYAYLPLAGLAVLLPWAIRTVPAPAVYRPACAAAAVLVLILGVLSFQMTNSWKDPDQRWQREAARHPDAVEPWVHLGQFRWMLARAAAPDADDRDARYAEAAEAWRTVLERAPEHQLAQRRLGIIHYELGAWGDAETVLEQAARRMPENPEVALYLALARDQRNRAGDADGDLIGALRAFRRAARLGPLPADAQVRYGMLAASFGNLDTAVPLLQQAAGDQEDSPLAQPLERFQAMANQQQQLEQQARSILQEQPEAPEGLLLRAEKLLLEGRSLAAFYLLQFAIDQAPDRDELWALLGYASARIDSAEQFLAERGASRATRLGPWVQLATRTAAGGRWEAAETYLRYGANKTGNLAMPELQMAEIALQLRQATRATQYLETAQQAYPQSPDPWLRLADMAIAAEEFGRARALLDGAAERNASEEALQPRRDRLEGEAPATSGIEGIERTVIK